MSGFRSLWRTPRSWQNWTPRRRVLRKDLTSADFIGKELVVARTGEWGVVGWGEAVSLRGAVRYKCRLRCHLAPSLPHLSVSPMDSTRKRRIYRWS